MIRILSLLATLAALSACQREIANGTYEPGPNHSLATSSCTNGDPALRQAKLGCPN